MRLRVTSWAPALLVIGAIALMSGCQNSSPPPSGNTPAGSSDRMPAQPPPPNGAPPANTPEGQQPGQPPPGATPSGENPPPQTPPPPPR